MPETKSMTAEQEHTSDVFLLEGKRPQVTLNVPTAADALVGELLLRIAQYGCQQNKAGEPTAQVEGDGCNKRGFDDSSSKHNTDNTSELGDGKENDVESTPLTRDDMMAFEYFPQFRNCVDADARYILAQKYLVANRYNVKEAMKMVLRTNTFRKQHKLDSIMLFPSLIPLRGFTNEAICETLNSPAVDKVIETRTTSDGVHVNPSEYLNNYHILQPIFDIVGIQYASSIHYSDKEGHPVMYGSLQHLKPKQLYSGLQRITPLRQRPENLVLLYHLYGNELLGKIVQYCDRVREKQKQLGIITSEGRITTATIVIDCNGIRLRDFITGSFRKMLFEMLRLDQKYYPEVIHRLILANLPGGATFTHWFVKFFGATKRGLRRKIICLSKRATPEVLASMIDRDKIPEFLGGTCSCLGGCVPLKSAVLGTESSFTAIATSCNISAVYTPGNDPTRGSDDLSMTCDSHTNTSPWCDGTQNLVLPPRSKHTVSYNMRPGEDITWEFAASRGKVNFTAVFIHCSFDGYTEVLSDVTKVTESADHYVANTRGELIFTWNNTDSLFTRRKIQLRVHHSRLPSDPISPQTISQ